MNHPNGIELPFDFKKLLDTHRIRLSLFRSWEIILVIRLIMSNLEEELQGSGMNVDLLNTLVPYKQPIYYYDKTETIKVKPEVENNWKDVSLQMVNSASRLRKTHLHLVWKKLSQIKMVRQPSQNCHFTKKVLIHIQSPELAGRDKDVDYDAMEVNMTVKVTKDANGDLQATVKYSGTGGFASSADDKVFNNYVVAPVKTKFNFSKALARSCP